MPKRSNKYQKLVTAIHACIANDVSVEESAFLIDKETGEEREVDILLQSRLGDYPVSVSVEVVDRSRPAGSDWVEEMTSKHQALTTNKLVLVSRSGFTKPALKKAKAREIETLTIEEACDTDWKMALRLQGQGVFQLFNVHFSCSAHLSGRSDWFPATLLSRVFIPGEQHPTEVINIVNFVLSDPVIRETVFAHFDSTREKEYHAVYTPPEGTLFEESLNVRTGLIKLSIGLRLEFEATPVEFASGRFRGRQIAYGQARKTDDLLSIVMRRKENGRIEGVLYDSSRLRRLLVDENPPITG